MDAVLPALPDSSRRTVPEALGHAEATAGELAALLPIARPEVCRSPWEQRLSALHAEVAQGKKLRAGERNYEGAPDDV